jgi:thiol:disulfide interchange protein DsbC
MLRRLLVVLFCSLPVFGYASEDIQAVKDKLAKAFPNVPVDKLRPSVLSGFYELEVEAQLVYVSTDGKYIFFGDLVDLATRKNLTEAWRLEAALRMIDEVGEKNMIVIGPAKAKRTITVFTDVDCPYCAKLHLEVPELNKNGVKVRYLLFPRGGIGSETYRRSVAVWCASDRAKAVGVAKAGGKLDMKTCANPVESHYRLGERIGVSGTPTIYLDDGKKLGGYVPSAQLLAILGLNGVPKTSNAR